jgi:hypothetical protein
MILPLACLSAFAHGQARLPPAIGATVYVQASRTNMRAQPQASAAVLAQPVTNTAFKLLAKQGDWCEVDGAVDDSTVRHGFIACNFLGTDRLTLAYVDAQLDKKNLDARTLLDWHSRAFWIAPSLTRWSAVGVALENAFLNEETRNREITGAKPLRFKVPEFEAMKQRLGNGLQVTPDALAVPQGVPTAALNAPDTPYEHMKSAAQRIRLPAIKSSFFKAGEVPVIVAPEKYGENDSVRTVALVDALSAANKTVFQATVTGPAQYAMSGEMHESASGGELKLLRVSSPLDIIVGVWDVGSLRVNFRGGALLHGVTKRGEPSAEAVDGVEIPMGTSTSCAASPMDLKAHPVPGYARPADAIVRWAGKPMPGGDAARAQVKSRQIGGKSQYNLVLMHEIDLNGDGIADFVVWQGRYEPQVSAEGIWNAVFANIDGQWMLLSYDEDADCT